MKPTPIIILAASALLLAVSVSSEIDKQTAPKPGVVVPAPVKQPDPPKQPDPEPDDCPPDKPWGPHPRRPHRETCGQQVFGERDGSVHSGQAVQVDLPCDQLVRNCGGSDGAGLCVFTSIMFAARLQNVPQLKDFQAWMKQHRGGGFPQKVDAMIKRKCKEQNVPIPDYIQVENGDWKLVELALKTGRMPAITYGWAHMVNIVCLTNGFGAFRDNNFIGKNEIDWMTAAQAKQKAGGSHFWAVILLAPRPPMPPKNAQTAVCEAPYVPGSYSWQRIPDCLQWALYRDGEQVGSYDAESDFYAVRKGSGEWGPYYRRPPVDLPPEALPALAGRVPGGVFFKYEGGPRYSRNGIVISKEEAFAALKLVDDSQKLSLTVIGTQAEQDAVRAALVADAGFASRVCFQGYLPDEWAVNTERFGFVHDGKPTIYLQKPTGEVLYRCREFTTSTISDLRQKDPNYKPENDPGIKPDTHPASPLAGNGPPNLTVLLLCAGAVVVVLVLLQKENAL